MFVIMSSSERSESIKGIYICTVREDIKMKNDSFLRDNNPFESYDDTTQAKGNVGEQDHARIYLCMH